jgi:hypothetical protein
MRDVLARASNDTIYHHHHYTACHRHGESNSGRDDDGGGGKVGPSSVCSTMSVCVYVCTQLASSSSNPNDSRLTGQITVPVRKAMMHRHSFFSLSLSSTF